MCRQKTYTYIYIIIINFMPTIYNNNIKNYYKDIYYKSINNYIYKK